MFQLKALISSSCVEQVISWASIIIVWVNRRHIGHTYCGIRCNSCSRWPTTPILEDINDLCHICSTYVVEQESYFVLQCPFYNSVRDMFPSLFPKEMFSCLDFSYQHDHHVNILVIISQRPLHYITSERNFCDHTVAYFNQLNMLCGPGNNQIQFPHMPKLSL